MQVGRLNRLVTLQRLVEGQDSVGQPVQTWAEVAQVWANIRYLNGIESIKAGAETSVSKASIRVRRRADLTAAMRVSIGETVFQVKAVLPDEHRREHIDLLCEVLT